MRIPSGRNGVCRSRVNRRGGPVSQARPISFRLTNQRRFHERACIGLNYFNCREVAFVATGKRRAARSSVANRLSSSQTPSGRCLLSRNGFCDRFSLIGSLLFASSARFGRPFAAPRRRLTLRAMNRSVSNTSDGSSAPATADESVAVANDELRRTKKRTLKHRRVGRR